MNQAINADRYAHACVVVLVRGCAVAVRCHHAGDLSIDDVMKERKLQALMHHMYARRLIDMGVAGADRREERAARDGGKAE